MMDDKNDNQEDNSPELKSELDLLNKKSQEYLDGWKRAKADYLNLKKETEARQREIIEFANAALIAEFLPIYNNFKLAWQHVPEEQKKSDWVAGFGHIKSQFVGFLKDIGIEEIKTINEKFDPSQHEAVVHEEKPGFESEVIFEEINPGYTLHGRVVIPAKVKVAK